MNKDMGEHQEISAGARDEIKPVRAIVLAAGKGKRLQSENAVLPKVLRETAGRPLLAWVLDNLTIIEPENTVLVVGYQAEKVRQAIGPAYQYAMQTEQLGTGHAVAVTAPLFEDYDGDVLVICGDMPLIKPETYRNLVLKHQRSGADCTLLTAITDDIPDYGRIVRNERGEFAGIVERKDCTPAQLKINEVNPAIYVFHGPLLFRMLRGLRNNNAQGEYYLTDVPLMILQAGYQVATEPIHDDHQIIGVNTPADLALCEKYLLEERQ